MFYFRSTEGRLCSLPPHAEASQEVILDSLNKQEILATCLSVGSVQAVRPVLFVIEGNTEKQDG